MNSTTFHSWTEENSSIEAETEGLYCFNGQQRNETRENLPFSHPSHNDKCIKTSQRPFACKFLDLQKQSIV